MAFVDSVTNAEESVAAVMGRFPEMALPLIELTEVVMRSGACAFSAAERELIAAYTSGLNACTYCHDTHRAAAQAFGVDAALLGALLDDLEAAPVAPRLRPVLRFVHKLTRAPSRVSAADAQAVFAAGWDERDFHYAVTICALFNFYNRIIEGNGVKNTAEFRHRAGTGLAQNGYRPVSPAPRDD